MSEDPEKWTYKVPHASSTNKEVIRLDETHVALREYFDGRLSLAPLEESTPKAILELGCGSGLWAIQAAEQFPDARVIGVDLRTVPSSRAMPSNMEFMAVDLNNALPFDENSFDVIHTRFTLIHLPDPIDVVNRVIPLLRPGGWLVIEDHDMTFHDTSKLGLGPATTSVVKAVHATMMNRHVQSGSGSYDEMLREKAVFDEVNTRVIPVYMSATSDDPKLNKLGANWRENLARVGELLAAKGTFGVTLEDAKMAREEMANQGRNTRASLICTWARKK